MRSASLSFASISVAPIAASFVILTVADVGKGVWLVQILAVCLAALLAFVGVRFVRVSNREIAAFVVIALALLGLGAPLLGSAAGPERWLPVGSFSLYMAPVLLPSFLATCSIFLRDRGRVIVLAALVVAGGLLAAQPDASQVLALCVGAAVLLLHEKCGFIWSGVVLIGLMLATFLAFIQPDPLQPVPHVEGVFALAFSQSWLAGVTVAGSAVVFLVGLCWKSRPQMPWFLAVAAYYMVLYACSLGGLTPAPLVGYGTGPILGFGLLVAMSGTLRLIESDTNINV